MEVFKEVSDRFNVFDYINLIISGSYLIIGIYFTFYSYFPEIISITNNIQGETLFIYCVLFFGVAFVVGATLETLISPAFKHLKMNIIYNSLKRNRIDKSKNKSIIDNNVKIAKYVHNADALFHRMGLGDFDPDNKMHVGYFFAYCEYFNQVRGLNRKTEIFREIYGLAREIWIASLILLILCMIKMLLWGFTPCRGILLVIFFVASFIFKIRTIETLKNRIRMVLAIYDVIFSETTGNENLPMEPDNQVLMSTKLKTSEMLE